MNIVRWVSSGYIAPRLQTRRLLDAGHGPDVIVLIFLLGFLVQSIFMVLMGSPATAETGIGAHVSRLIWDAALFIFLAFLVGKLGRLSGGTGTQPETFMAMAWYTLLSSFLAPFVIGFQTAMAEAMENIEPGQAADPAALEISSSVMILAMAAFMMSVWLLANIVAELHRFKNLWGVIGVIVGLPMGIAMVLFSAMSMLAMAPGG